MREIKFRAWHGRMTEPLSLEYLAEEMPLNIKDWAWMQYTGLKDKNGKEIFEGDIVKYGGYYPGEIHKSEVLFGEGYWVPLVNVEEGYNAIDNYHSEDYEIIGNIYEHPELLGTKQ